MPNSNSNGNAAYGVTVNVFPTQAAESLADATNRLIAGLQASNPKMLPSGAPQPIHVDGENALSVRFTSESPSGGGETDWLVAVARPQGLLYFICIAPSGDFDDYNPAFQELIASVRLAR